MDPLFQHFDIIVFGVCQGNLDLKDWIAHVDNIDHLPSVRIAAVFVTQLFETGSCPVCTGLRIVSYARRIDLELIGEKNLHNVSLHPFL